MYDVVYVRHAALSLSSVRQAQQVDDSMGMVGLCRTAMLMLVWVAALVNKPLNSNNTNPSSICGGACRGLMVGIVFFF